MERNQRRSSAIARSHGLLTGLRHNNPIVIDTTFEYNLPRWEIVLQTQQDTKFAHYTVHKNTYFCKNLNTFSNLWLVLTCLHHFFSLWLCLCNMSKCLFVMILHTRFLSETYPCKNQAGGTHFGVLTGMSKFSAYFCTGILTPTGQNEACILPSSNIKKSAPVCL